MPFKRSSDTRQKTNYNSLMYHHGYLIHPNITIYIASITTTVASRCFTETQSTINPPPREETEETLGRDLKQDPAHTGDPSPSAGATGVISYYNRYGCNKQNLCNKSLFVRFTWSGEISRGAVVNGMFLCFFFLSIIAWGLNCVSFGWLCLVAL